MFPSGVGGDPKQLKRDRNITLNYWWWSSVAAGRLDKELFAQVFQYKKTMISQCCSLTVSIAHRSQENHLFHTWGLWLPFGLWPIRTKQYLLSNKQIILAFFFFFWFWYVWLVSQDLQFIHAAHSVTNCSSNARCQVSDSQMHPSYCSSILRNIIFHLSKVRSWKLQA